MIDDSESYAEKYSYTAGEKQKESNHCLQTMIMVDQSPDIGAVAVVDCIYNAGVIIRVSGKLDHEFLPGILRGCITEGIAAGRILSYTVVGLGGIFGAKLSVDIEADVLQGGADRNRGGVIIRRKRRPDRHGLACRKFIAAGNGDGFDASVSFLPGETAGKDHILL